MSSSRVSRRPHQCITTSIALTLCGRMLFAPQTIHCGRPVAMWGSRRMQDGGRTSSAGTGTSWRVGRCKIRHVSSGSPTDLLSGRLSRNGGGVRTDRRIMRLLICSLVVEIEIPLVGDTLRLKISAEYQIHSPKLIFITLKDMVDQYVVCWSMNNIGFLLRIDERQRTYSSQGAL